MRDNSDEDSDGEDSDGFHDVPFDWVHLLCILVPRIGATLFELHCSCT